MVCSTALERHGLDFLMLFFLQGLVRLSYGRLSNLCFIRRRFLTIFLLAELDFLAICTSSSNVYLPF